jgi:hypothetical protein
MKRQAAGKREAIIFLAGGLVFAGIVFSIIRFFNPIV